MTREEAIKLLREDGCGYCTWQSINPYECENKECTLKEALNMAIQALSQEPTKREIEREYLFQSLCEDFKKLQAENDDLRKRLEQEPCDAISRKDVINAIDKWISEYKPQHYLIQSIRDLPPVTQKSGKWIPVSERLPEAFRFVNCTCHSLIDDREDWVVETCYIPQPPDSPYSDWGNIPMLNMGDCEVVAWIYRDIPKPYKVEPQERSE